MTIQEKITGFFQNYLGDRYPITEWFDVTDSIEPEGQLTINVHSIDSMGFDDFKISVTISGQILMEEDKNKAKINAMSMFLMGKIQKLTVDELSNSIECVVGLILNDSNMVSDGDTNNIDCSFDIIVSGLIFDE